MSAEQDAIEFLRLQTKEARLYLKRIDGFLKGSDVQTRHIRELSQVMDDFLQQVKAETRFIVK